MKRMYLYTLALCFIYAGCNKISLDNQDAALLIIKTLPLPRRYSMPLGIRDLGALHALRDEGLIEYFETQEFLEAIQIQVNVTPLGEPMYLGMAGDDYSFKTHDIDFGTIVAIAVNQEQQTAIVRFTLKATNVTTFAKVLSKTQRGFSGHTYIPYSVDQPIQGELTFKKFDTGWQLQADQNTDRDILLERILKDGK